jgi:hypothetical protein
MVSTPLQTFCIDLSLALQRFRKSNFGQRFPKAAKQ